MNIYYKYSFYVLSLFIINLLTNCRDNKSINEVKNDNSLIESPATFNRILLNGNLLFRNNDSFSDLAGITVYLINDLNDWYKTNNRQHAVYTTNSFSDGYYFFKNIEPGRYILSAWLDADNNSLQSSGDISGTYGAGVFPNIEPYYVNINRGDTLKIDINIFTVP
jgi:hypothetical protein